MKSVTFDGGLYVYMGVSAAIIASLTSDGAAHYIDPKTLWFCQQIIGWSNAGALALKMYRSTQFAASKLNGNATQAQSAALGIVHTGHTEFITKPQTETKPNEKTAPPTP